MNNLIAIFIGSLIAIMIEFNGVLSNALGNYYSTVIIHVVGLIGTILIFIIGGRELKLRRGIPLILYSGGVIGVFTVLFTNISFTGLGISLTVALGLLGQATTSLLIDTYGLLGMDRKKFDKRKILAFIIILLGIMIMAFY